MKFSAGTLDFYPDLVRRDAVIILYIKHIIIMRSMFPTLKLNHVVSIHLDRLVASTVKVIARSMHLKLMIMLSAHNMGATGIFRKRECMRAKHKTQT